MYIKFNIHKLNSNSNNMNAKLKDFKIYVQNKDDIELKTLITENGGQIVGYKDKFTHYISSKTYESGIKIDK